MNEYICKEVPEGFGCSVRTGYERVKKLVRCKDCHYYEADRICAECLQHNGFSPEPDFFCADGELKE